MDTFNNSTPPGLLSSEVAERLYAAADDPTLPAAFVSVWSTAEPDLSIEMCDLCVGTDTIEQVFGQGGA